MDDPSTAPPPRVNSAGGNMGIFEALAIWVAISIVFSASLGKILTMMDRRTTAREEEKRLQRRQVLTRASV